MIKRDEIERHIYVNWYKIGKKLKIIMRLRITFISEKGLEHTVIFRHDFSKKIDEVKNINEYILKHIEKMKHHFINEALKLVKKNSIKVSIIEFIVKNDEVIKRVIEEDKEFRFVKIRIER